MDNLWLWVLLAGLADYRAAHMLSQEGDSGPFDIFTRLRTKVGKTSWVGRGLHCFSCCSFWGGLVAALLLSSGLPWNLFLLVWGAVSAVAFAFWRYFG